MTIGEISRFVLPIVVSVLLFAYAGFCWVKQKVHVRGKGWQTREESTKTFYFTIAIMILLGIGQLFSLIYFAKF